MKIRRLEGVGSQHILPRLKIILRFVANNIQVPHIYMNNIREKWVDKLSTPKNACFYLLKTFRSPVH